MNLNDNNDDDERQCECPIESGDVLEAHTESGSRRAVRVETVLHDLVIVAGEEAQTPDDAGRDELPMHRSAQEVAAAWDIFDVPAWALAEFGCSDVGLDNLCCCVTTCRDDDGVVAADRLAWLRPDQLELVAASGHYSHDEVFPEPAVLPSLDLGAVDYGCVNHLKLCETTGGQWRDLVAAGLPVERALAGVLVDIMRDGIQKLPPHLLHALERRPHVARAAAESIIVALQNVDHGF